MLSLNSKFKKVFMTILFTLRVFVGRLLKGGSRRNSFFFLRDVRDDLSCSKKKKLSPDYIELCITIGKKVKRITMLLEPLPA